MAALKSKFMVGSLFWEKARRSPDAVGKGRLDRLAGVKCAKDGDGFDGCERKLGRDVVVDRREADDLDVEPAACRLHRLELLAAKAAQAEFEGATHDRLPDGVGVRGELVADRRSDEVGAIGIETFAHQEIDVAKVDESEVDRDLFAVAGPVSQPVNLRSHRCLSIQLDGSRMVDELQEGFSASQAWRGAIARARDAVRRGAANI